MAALVESKVGDPANYGRSSTKQRLRAIPWSSGSIANKNTQNAATWRSERRSSLESGAVEDIGADGIGLTGDILYVALVVTPDWGTDLRMISGHGKATPMLAYKATMSGSARQKKQLPVREYKSAAGMRRYENRSCVWTETHVYVAPDGILRIRFQWS